MDVASEMAFSRNDPPVFWRADFADMKAFCKGFNATTKRVSTKVHRIIQACSAKNNKTTQGVGNDVDNIHNHFTHRDRDGCYRNLHEQVAHRAPAPW